MSHKGGTYDGGLFRLMERDLLIQTGGDPSDFLGFREIFFCGRKNVRIGKAFLDADSLHRLRQPNAEPYLADGARGSSQLFPYPPPAATF